MTDTAYNMIPSTEDAYNMIPSKEAAYNMIPVIPTKEEAYNMIPSTEDAYNMLPSKEGITTAASSATEKVKEVGGEYTSYFGAAGKLIGKQAGKAVKSSYKN